MLLDTTFMPRISHVVPTLEAAPRGTWWCRCPYCGDSKKDPNKKRGRFRVSPSDPTKVFFKCFNCGIGRSLRNFLRDTDEAIYRDYVRDSLKSSWSSGPRDDEFWNTGPVKAPDPIRKYPLPEDWFTPVLELPSDHAARVYLAGRKVPNLHRVWYTDDFRGVSHELDRTKFVDRIWPESRIVFPLMSADGTRMVGFQGRAMDPENRLRYVMIMLDRSSPRFFGLESINTSLPVTVVEGPIDSLFLPNCVALCGATNLGELPFPDAAWFLDQEPRNPQVMQRIRGLVDAGRRVVLLPREYHEKDVNEMVLSGMRLEKIYELVKSHTYTGLRARAVLASWST